MGGNAKIRSAAEILGTAKGNVTVIGPHLIPSGAILDGDAVVDLSDSFVYLLLEGQHVVWTGSNSMLRVGDDCRRLRDWEATQFSDLAGNLVPRLCSTLRRLAEAEIFKSNELTRSKL